MSWSTSKTWAVGDVLTAADANSYIRDRLDYLGGEVWHSLGLSAGWSWVDTGWSQPGYRLVGDMVQLRGFVGGGTTGSVVANIPVGYRPTGSCLFLTTASGSLGRLDVTSAGILSWTNVGGASTFISLDMCRWFIN